MVDSSQKKKSHFHLEKHQIRPTVYQVFTRYLISLCFSLLWDFLFNQQAPKRPVSFAFTLFAVFYIVMAWFAYLRQDGIRMPKFDRRLFQRRKRNPGPYADIIDFVDEDIPTFDELDEDEQDQCLLISNLITALLLLLTSLFYT